MGTKKIRKDKSYHIIISSLTDANKKARALTMTRSGIVTSIICIVLVVVLSVGAAVFSVSEVLKRQSQADTLAGRVDEQLLLLSAYENRLTELQLAKTQRDAAEATQGMALAGSAQETTGMGAQESVEPLVSVQEAVQSINSEYTGEINAQVDALKQVATADEVEVVYSGDFDGDSDTVNNWSEVLAIFVVAAGYDLSTLQLITETDCGLLEQIYRDMNRYEITSHTVPVVTPAESGGEAVYSTLMTISIAVDSIDCDTYAKELSWTKEQKHALSTFRDTKYNMTYAALLGVNLYEGLNSDELAAIIDGLDPNLIGTTIVKAALTRLGDPYSNARRNSGNYADCSSLVHWAYQQAGIDIPSTSVEQAKYCYNNGYTVDLDELQPGDLLYWQKTSCHCGRWHEIHHAGIYIGNNLVIEASSSQGCVVIRPLWSGGVWRLYMAGRPYTEEPPTVSIAPVPAQTDSK